MCYICSLYGRPYVLFLFFLSPFSLLSLSFSFFFLLFSSLSHLSLFFISLLSLYSSLSFLSTSAPHFLFIISSHLCLFSLSPLFYPLLTLALHENAHLRLQNLGVLAAPSCNVTLALTLAPADRAVQATITVDAATAEQRSQWALWRVGMALCGLGAASDDNLFVPEGYGVSIRDPVRHAAHSSASAYPSSGATMQFLAAGGGAATAGAGGYLGAHDPAAHMKTLGVTVTSGSGSKPSQVNTEAEPLDGRSVPAPAGSLAAALAAANASSSPSTALSIEWLVTDAGLPRTGPYVAPFPIAVAAVAPITASTPLWYGAAQIYRMWALARAPWAGAGPVRNRTDTPTWLLETHVWVNSGWQCHDVFNATQGAPENVLTRTRAIRTRFNVTRLGLHWYEFQQGPNPSPDARYKFDTHYPDYLPPRGGADFATFVAALKDDGILVFPYINGRIFDVASVSYTTENGSAYCTQAAAPGYNSTQLSFYQESYGSGATFHVADPTER